MDNIVSSYRRLPIRANTWHKEFSDTLYFAKKFLFLASITSFTVDTLNSLILSTVSFNLMSNNNVVLLPMYFELFKISFSGGSTYPDPPLKGRKEEGWVEKKGKTKGDGKKEYPSRSENHRKYVPEFPRPTAWCRPRGWPPAGEI